MSDHPVQAAIDQTSLSKLLPLFFLTHAFYHDRPSRRAVQRCLVIFSRKGDEKLLTALVGAIKREAQKPTIAPSSAFVLLEWCSQLIENLAGTALWAKLGKELILASADCLERCLQSPFNKHVGHSALVVTRRAFRKIVSPASTREQAITEAVQLLATKGAQPTAKYSVTLGVIAGVCSRKDYAKPILEKLKPQYFGFYTREIIGSRTPVPNHLAEGLYDFFHSFLTLEELGKDVIPSLEKGLLRAPEIVLNDLVTPLVGALPAQYDLSGILSNNLLKPLLSNTKSTNPTIRSGALAAFKTIIPRASNLEALGKATDEIATPLKGGKVASADQRAIHSEMLMELAKTEANATKICLALPMVAGKEGNEPALAAETSALTEAVKTLLKSGAEVPAAVVDAFKKGLADKKPTSRKLWVLAAGELLLDVSQTTPLSAPALKVTEGIMPVLFETYNDAVANPPASSQSGLITGAYITCSIAPLVFGGKISAPLEALSKKFSIAKHCLVAEPKPSFLLTPRLYSKLTSNDDLRWLSRALTAVVNELPDDGGSSISLAWSQALIYLVSSATTSSQVRKEVCQQISDLYQRNPQKISSALTSGIWHWLGAGEEGDKDSAAMLAKADTTHLNLILRAICLPARELPEGAAEVTERPALEAQMCSLLVLARPELVPRSSWIDLCLRVGLDPGELAKNNEKVLLQEVAIRSTLDQKVPPYFRWMLNPSPCWTQLADLITQQSAAIRNAAYKAAVELVFVAPDVMTPRIIQLIEQDLDVADLEGIGPLEAAIFRTPEGTAFVDVLAKKSSNVPTKGKEADTLRWEAELRSQLAQKKGQQQKLSADDKAKVDAQLKKESAIRERVRGVAAKAMRGIGVIQSLATGPPTDAGSWMGPAVKALLGAIDAGACLITEDAAPLAYLACADRVSTRLGSFREFIGVATLRAHDVELIPENLKQEPLHELVTRVLYRLRFAGEQRPFDSVSAIYMLPLVLLVLQKGGFGGTAEDKDTQIVLATEFLGFHTDASADEALPRAEMLETLISSMQQYNQHYKIIRDCFSDMVRCLAPNISEKEIGVVARGAIVPQTSVRTTVLQSISADVDMSELEFSEEIWLACHEDNVENVDLGREIWEESGFEISEEVPTKMLPYLESKDGQLRRAASRALAEACKHHRKTVNPILEKLRLAYVEFAKPRVPELDEFGMPKKMDLSDPWEARHGIASAFKELSPYLERQHLDAFFALLIEQGPLGDQNSSVRAEMLEAANKAIEVHGKSIVDKLMKVFEKTLEAPDKGSAASDRVNEAVIIMYGALARHLKAGDAKIPVVIERLLATLSTPSEAVQYAIAECLPPLIRSCGNKASKYFEEIMETLLTSKKYAVQRGAAYGLAGLVLGRGIVSLREHRIMTTLSGALENKKDASQRESALLAYELLATMLGRLFEPYVIQIVPQLLTGFGDSNANVRDAALASAKACFARLSSYGVKNILPTLLNGLDDDQWRSKKGACDLLGAMAYLDPQQLALSLPEIIPPLTAVLNDSHKEVRSAANKSLKRFGEVINNPEIKGLVDTLLKALSDPTKHTDEALDSLIKVQFVHYLDAPSLALVSRILQRGLGDRSNTKRKASQVIGSLAHLTERKDLVSHLPVLVAGLKVAVVDPVPTTRATASRALGSLVEKLGEEALPDLIPGLIQTLKSDTGAGDRLGSAQALSEVLAGLGTTRLEETLPTILQNVESSKPAVREGFMSLFIFLPVCFGNSFANYLGRIIPPILSGLADDVEAIRETALKAGRLLVKNFAVRAVDLLLPELERGLADDSYRIRLSSVELVGDLLFNLTGVSANQEPGDEEEEERVKEAGASLREALGDEKRNKILSALYICRCDTAGAVRTAAIAVWKALVSSPRTLKELVPTLTQLIIRRLGSFNMEHKVIASNALGELIRKAGDNVLATLLPTLEEGLQTSTDVDARQGICLALKELISSASEEALEDHEKTLISVVRTALTDSDDDVREAAAEAFDSLQQILGKRAVDQVLPYLLSLLRSEDEAENALSALLTLLTETTRSNIILPNLIPTLIAPPISAFNAKALASLSKVAGAAMNRRLPNIINSLMENLVNCTDDGLRADLDASFHTVILSIDEYDGLNTIMNVLLQLTKHEDHRKRAATDLQLAKFFAATDVDYSRYNQDIIRSLLVSFDDQDMGVVKAAWSALSEFTKKLRKEEMEALVSSTRQTLLLVGVAGSNLRGFELPKGINAILPIFLQGLMNGSPDQKTQAALAISDIVDRTSEASLKPFVTQITGPLIRVVSERSTEVKSAILLTLNNLLEKMPMALKPFLPQLQRTFAKSLADTTSEQLRTRAAKALGTLIKFTPRVDPLIAELVTGSKTSDPGVKTAMLKALFEVISKAGANMGEPSRAAVLGLIDMETDEKDDAMTITNAKLLGALVKNVPADAASTLIKTRVLTPTPSGSSMLGLNAVLLESPKAILESPWADELPDILCQGMSSKIVSFFVFFRPSIPLPVKCDPSNLTLTSPRP